MTLTARTRIRRSSTLAATAILTATVVATPGEAVAATHVPRDLGQVTALDIDDRGRVLTTTTFAGKSLLGLTPMSVNNKGEVAGSVDGRPAMWRDGTITAINPPAGTSGPFSTAGISDHGEVLLLGGDTGGGGGYVWRKGRYKTLTGGAAVHMNTAGQVFGFVYSGGGRYGGLDGVIWQRGELTPTGGFGGYQTEILALGRDGGVSATSHHADFWCGDGLYDGAFTTPFLAPPAPGAPTFPAGEWLYEPHVVNASGEQAGPVGYQVYAARPDNPYIVCPAGFSDIGTGVALHDGQWLVDFTPTGINDRGLVVGNRTLPDGRSQAVVFDHGRTTVLPARSPGDATYASEVNKQGRVLGTSGNHTVVWTYRRG
jgi:hypothetical protein